MAADSISYDTAKLIAVIPNLKKAQKWLANTFFNGMIEFDTEEVAIDTDVGKRRLAPFVSPLVEGRMVEARRVQTDKFKPAYVKDKRAPDLRRPVRRMIGERIGGELTPRQRALANLQFEMEDQIDMIDRRLEWMASTVLQAGTITIAGEGFPTTIIDFGRDPALTLALTGSNVWGYASNFDASGHDPLPPANLDTWQALVLKKSGAVMTDIVFTNKSWNLFKNGSGVQAAINYPSLNPSGNIINPGAQIQRGAVLKGYWGQYRLWLYNDWYVDVNDVEQPMIPDGYVIMCGPDIMGTQSFGVILDEDVGYGPMAYAPKTWVIPDPSQRLIMMQSAPLLIPGRVNAMLAAKVA
ncbi:MAG: major capsid protein [Caulobacteraceae bacterium]|nr:major capsid protein [Caulobacteraceae bacterium]